MEKTGSNKSAPKTEPCAVCPAVQTVPRWHAIPRRVSNRGCVPFLGLPSLSRRVITGSADCARELLRVNGSDMRVYRCLERLPRVPNPCRRSLLSEDRGMRV
jgi:hypothetical protein